MRVKYKISKSEKRYNTSIIVGFFVTAFLYGIFGDTIADISMILYLIGLFSIVPTYLFLAIFIKKIYEKSSSKSIKYGACLLFISVLLILYVFTQYAIFLYAMIGLSAIVGFINYILYLEIKHRQRLSLLQSRSKYRRMFKTYLKNKNFLNHHNYYISLENKSFYKKSIWKKGVISYVVGSGFIAFFILISNLNEILKGEMSLGLILGMYIILFIGIIFIGVAIFLFKYSKKLIFGNTQKNEVQLYQGKIKVSNFVRFRKKIFFY